MLSSFIYLFIPFPISKISYDTGRKFLLGFRINSSQAHLRFSERDEGCLIIVRIILLSVGVPFSEWLKHSSSPLPALVGVPTTRSTKFLLAKFEI